MTTEEKLRDQAARPTLLRIQADIERANPRLKPLLRTVKKRLFDKSFNVCALWREHGIRDRNAAAIFQELDTSPSAYILRARMETAESLLQQTALQKWCISQLVGYTDERTFRKTFQKWKGCSPARFRRRKGHRRLVRPGFEQELADAVAGRLCPQRGDQVLERLDAALIQVRSLYAPSFDSLEPMLLDAEKMERVQAESLVFPRLAGLSFEDQRRLIQRSRPFSTPALFDVLHRSSREEGRKDHQRGIELSQLALDSVEANAETLGPRYHDLRPQARAWLGNAYRLALDFLAADQAIEEGVETLPASINPFVTGIVYLCKGTLRTFQRRHDEAVELFDVALPAFEEAGSESWQIKTLIQRAASLDCAESHEAALETLGRAAGLPGADVDYFAFLLPYTTAIALLRVDCFADARELLKDLSYHRGFGSAKWRNSWLEAYVDHGFGRLTEAEEKYLCPGLSSGMLSSHRRPSPPALDLTAMR